MALVLSSKQLRRGVILVFPSDISFSFLHLYRVNGNDESDLYRVRNDRHFLWTESGGVLK